MEQSSVIVQQETSRSSELFESNELLDISMGVSPEITILPSLLDGKKRISSPVLSDNEKSLIRIKTNSTELVLKDMYCQKVDNWFSIKNSDYIHEKEKEQNKMYYSNPIYSIVETTNNVMDDSWRFIKKAGNLISDIAGHSV